MKIFKLLFLAVALIEPQQLLAVEASDAKTHLEADERNPGCPSQDFSNFLHAYSENIAIQERFISYPLERQYLEMDAEPEPKPVAQHLPRDQVNFPVIPASADRKARHLNLRTELIDSKTARLFLAKADTDHQAIYFFRKESCWTLYQIEDWSL